MTSQALDPTSLDARARAPSLVAAPQHGASEPHSAEDVAAHSAPRADAYEPAQSSERALVPRTLKPLEVPHAKRESSYLFGASAAAMMVAGLVVLKPGFGLAEDAPEHPSRTPRQPKDEIERRERLICVSARIVEDRAPLVNNPTLSDRRHKLASGFDLIFGSGFGGWLPILGVLPALEGDGLMRFCTGLYGVSAGALTLALYRCLDVDKAGDELLNFGAARFLDLSLSTLLTDRAICAGKGVEDAVRTATKASPFDNIEQIKDMPLHLGVFDGERGRTVWPRAGDIAQLVARSCALPGLFPQRLWSDGGLVDHHGITAQREGKISLSVRLPTKLERTFEQRWVGRPEPLFNVSSRPEHVQMQLVTSEKVSLFTMLRDLDYDKAKLVRIVTEAEHLTKWYLRQPQS